MNADWQSCAAAAIVIVTVVLFVVRARRKGKGGCATCGSGHQEPPIVFRRK
ncbi:MAG TPA: hypothetical protein VGH65_09210 [Verrucomicrobiaceae bacterium]|jgi:hypothetical protein